VTPSRARIREALLLAAILLVFWWTRWPFRDAVLIRDEGEYAYIGQRILAGEVPYRDVYNQKTPFVFYAFAAAQAFLGPDVSSLRLFGSAYGLLSTSAVYLVARTAFGPVGAASAALAFTAMLFDQAGILHQASTEYFMLLWLALGVLAWGRAVRSGRPWLLAASGALAGIAFQTKQSGAVLLLFFLAEWGNLYVIGAIVTTLFLGGWYVPGLSLDAARRGAVVSDDVRATADYRRELLKVYTRRVGQIAYQRARGS